MVLIDVSDLKVRSYNHLESEVSHSTLAGQLYGLVRTLADYGKRPENRDKPAL